MLKRKICIITGTRAEYGRLFGLMREIQKDDDLELQTVVTGMHLSPEFGYTYKKIEDDGFIINEKIEMLLSSDTAAGVIKSMGVGLIGFADAFTRLRSDLIVVLGDRYEALVAAEAALIANIPIAHIHGGEVTEGAVDDSIRHAITKMSQIHLVGSNIYKKRVIQLGEMPEHVFEVGAPGNDNIVNLQLLDKTSLEKSIEFDLGDKFFLITYHPVTVKSANIDVGIQELCMALDEFQDYKVIFTKANSDVGGREINQLIDEYAEENKGRVYSITSLGQLRFLSAMKYCSAVIGNSSSGILEAPIFHVPTINIGSRQDGRERYCSIIDCNENKISIIESIRKAIAPEFQKKIRLQIIPYTDGHVAYNIKTILKKINLHGLCRKHFHDVNY